MYYSPKTNPVPGPKEVAARAKAVKDNRDDFTPDSFLDSIIRHLGRSCTYVVARNHLKEDGYSLTQEQFDRVYNKVYPAGPPSLVDLFKEKRL